MQDEKSPSVRSTQKVVHIVKRNFNISQSCELLNHGLNLLNLKFDPKILEEDFVFFFICRVTFAKKLCDKIVENLHLSPFSNLMIFQNCVEIKTVGKPYKTMLASILTFSFMLQIFLA